MDEVFTSDIVFGLGLIVLLLEACRRATGIVLTSVAVLFIAYIFLGPYLPEMLAHRGMRLDRFIDLQVLSTQAIFGTPISASANMVFYFIVVGAFLERSGAGKLFVDLAYCLTGRAWGGAGKASVISSGSFRNGVRQRGRERADYRHRDDPADEADRIQAAHGRRDRGDGIDRRATCAARSWGRRLSFSPISSGSAYANVVYAAVVPALLYYFSIFVVVDAYARRAGLGPDPSLPVAESLAGLRERWHLLLPLFFMIYLLMSQYSLRMTGAVTTLLIIAISWLRPATRMSIVAIYQAIVRAVRATVEVAIPSAVAGIIVGTLVQTGMALRLQRWLLDMAGGSLTMSAGWRNDSDHHSRHGDADRGGLSGVGDSGGARAAGAWRSGARRPSVHFLFRDSFDGHAAGGACGLRGCRH